VGDRFVVALSIRKEKKGRRGRRRNNNNVDYENIYMTSHFPAVSPRTGKREGEEKRKIRQSGKSWPGTRRYRKKVHIKLFPLAVRGTGEGGKKKGKEKCQERPFIREEGGEGEKEKLLEISLLYGRPPMKGKKLPVYRWKNERGEKEEK